MKGKAFPVSMALLWGMVFSQAMHSITLGICMGLLMGITFGLFESATTTSSGGLQIAL